MLIWSAAFCLIEKVFPCLYSETTSISPTHLLLSPSQIVLLHLLNLGFNLSLDFSVAKMDMLATQHQKSSNQFSKPAYSTFGGHPQGHF